MSSSNSWFYTRGATRLGPFEGGDLLQRIAEGEIGPETLVCAADRSEWEAAGEQAEFAAAFAARPTSPGASREALIPEVAEQMQRLLSHGESLLRAFRTLFVGGLLGLLADAFLSWAGAPDWLVRGLLFAGVAALALALGLHLVLLYRCWWAVQGEAKRPPRSTPGRAVALLFVPLFNLYWIFIAYRGLALELEARTERRGLWAPAGSGLWLFACIFAVLPGVGLLALLLLLPGMTPLLRAAEQLARSRLAGAAGHEVGDCQAPLRDVVYGVDRLFGLFASLFVMGGIGLVHVHYARLWSDAVEGLRLLEWGCFVVLAYAAVVGIVLLHACWKSVQGAVGFRPRTSPSRAGAFLFVPLLNLPWAALVSWGLASDQERLAQSLGLRLPPARLLWSLVPFAVGLGAVVVLVRPDYEPEVARGWWWIWDATPYAAALLLLLAMRATAKSAVRIAQARLA